MKRCIVVTEGPTDVLLLQAVLRIPEDDPWVQFQAAGGWSAADSLARSYLANGAGDVVLVVDADTIDPQGIEERKQFLRHSLAEIASAARKLVVVMVPALEVVLFADRSLLETLVGREVSEVDFVRGQYEPVKVLQSLLGNEPWSHAFARRLPYLDLDAVRSLAPLRELQDFLAPANIALHAA